MTPPVSLTPFLAIQFGKGGNATSLKGEGWAADESGFTWSIGAASTLRVPVPAGLQIGKIVFRAFPNAARTDFVSQTLRIKIGDEVLGTYSISSRQDIECTIDRKHLDGRFHLDLRLEHPDATSPSNYGDSRDDRLLAIAFVSAEISGVRGETPQSDPDYFIPPNHLLIDGSTSPASFRSSGEGFTREFLFNRGKLMPHERVLDLGCGNGAKARVLASYLDHKGSYVGLDIVPSAIEWCKERYRVLPNFRFEVADVQSSHYNPTGRFKDSDYKFPFADGEFDVVFLCSVFTHMLQEGVANYIKEIARVLKPGGRCIATTFISNDESIAAEEAGRTSRRFLHKIGVARVLNASNPTMGVALDEMWLRSEYSKAGLRTTEMHFGMWRASNDPRAGSQDVVITRKMGG